MHFQNKSQVLKNSEPSFTDESTQAMIEIGVHQASLNIQYFHIDGVRQGNLNHLKFRPNNGFHPIDEIKLEAQELLIHFEQDIKPIQRHIKRQEITNLIEQIKHAERSLVHGQELYLYPSSLAFALNVHNEVKILLKNIHPHDEAEVKSKTQYTLRALVDLLKQHSPESWSLVEPELEQINTLDHLLERLTPKSVMSYIYKSLWNLFIILFLLFTLSLPIAAFGPSQLSEPLKEIYYPYFENFTQRLKPISTEMPVNSVEVNKSTQPNESAQSKSPNSVSPIQQ